MADENKNPLTATVNNIPAEMKEEYTKDLKATTEGITVRLPQIKIDHQEAMFKLPTSEGGKLIKDFEAVVLHHQSVNAYFIQESESPTPRCFSLDAVTPEEDVEDKQSDNCISCKQNQFGSAEKGRGKACKNMVRLHLFIAGENVPLRLSVPPTSKVAYEIYATTLAKEGSPVIAVKTKLSLSSINKGGMTWAEMQFKNAGKLSVEDWQSMKKIQKSFLKAMVRQSVEVAEYNDDDTKDNPF